MTKLYRTTGDLIAESETMSLKELVEANKHNLTNADLTSVDLFNADLFNANLFNANLAYADLSNANLTNADLTDARLAYANLNCAKGIAYAYCAWHRHGECGRQLLGVVIDGEVRLFCGCLSCGVEEFREFIKSGEERYRTSRTKALEFVLSCLEEGRL